MVCCQDVNRESGLGETGMTLRIAVTFLALAAPLAACGSVPGQPPAPGAPKPELVSFPSGGLTLHGLLYRPGPASRAPRAGPSPAMLWNHGSGKTPGEKPDLARFYTDHGFVFFLPYRHGHGSSPGDYIIDLEAR